MTQFVVKFLDRGRSPQCQPNPMYPEGIHLPDIPGEKCCRATVPYPAPRCGLWLVRCKTCGATMAATCAGRQDDPRSVPVACRDVTLPYGVGEGDLGSVPL